MPREGGVTGTDRWGRVRPVNEVPHTIGIRGQSSKKGADPAARRTRTWLLPAVPEPEPHSSAAVSAPGLAWLLLLHPGKRPRESRRRSPDRSAACVRRLERSGWPLPPTARGSREQFSRTRHPIRPDGALACTGSVAGSRRRSARTSPKPLRCALANGSQQSKARRTDALVTSRRGPPRARG